MWRNAPVIDPVMLDATLPDRDLNYRSWLQRELTERCRKNPRYSLRAFAKQVGLDASSVSQLLSGKRKASSRLVQRICNRLGARPELASALIESAKLRSPIGHPTYTEDNYYQLSVDAFAAIADWYHYAILELTFTDDFSSQPASIAKSLGISVTETKVAIDRLKRLGLLVEKDGCLTKSETQITNFSDGVTAPALKEFQRQILKKALDAIDSAEQDEKDITSMTMAIDPSRLPQARAMVRQFRRRLCAFLEDGTRARVYNLAIQLYPVSSKINKGR